MIPRNNLALRLAAALAAMTVLAIALVARAEDRPKEAQATSGKPMRMDEPMKGEMKKKGMKRGDVRKAAEKKGRELKPMMDKEFMPGAATK